MSLWLVEILHKLALGTSTARRSSKVKKLLRWAFEPFERVSIFTPQCTSQCLKIPARFFLNVPFPYLGGCGKTTSFAHTEKETEEDMRCKDFAIYKIISKYSH
ncbi:hypothetical protein A2T98_07690 [Nodularia spumigena CENA596]|uniref:Uncharacterized protein n=1 Tax=Nodularia spumigena CENA596 TaxID=1819295 RepID=A0A166K0H7_NODSP|nr:hypothetical protein A2T98_07690 [Nodularia spumigena CENA596]